MDRGSNECIKVNRPQDGRKMNSLGVWYVGVEKGSLKLFSVSRYHLACDDPQWNSHSELPLKVLYNLSANSSFINSWQQETREACRGDMVIA